MAGVLTGMGALLPVPAAAEFFYVAPDGERPLFSTLNNQGPLALAQVLQRMTPGVMRIRYDRRVDSGRPIVRDYPDWRSLVHGEGLAAAIHGEDVYIRPAELPAAEVELSPGGLDRWRIEAGERLHQVLERWGARAEVEILFLTDRGWELHAPRVVNGSFLEAVRSLFLSLAHLPHPPTGEFAENGRTLSVMHRVRGREEKE